jgi:hypothetical protein
MHRALRRKKHKDKFRLAAKNAKVAKKFEER